ncbi:MAG: aminoacyl-tRNA hydrolase [Spirochaetaceae bacterium]|nr:aminoacyl-tRNA hydrolase [Spirochaetaceae bacterium]
MVSLFVFMGNPGVKYQNTRHNAGRLFADILPLAFDWRGKFKGQYAPFTAPDGRKCHALIPETFMNNSGESVQAAAAFFKIPPQEILVVHDELELRLGQAGLKFGGGLGGHNGLRSINAHLGTPDFWRLRLGIGRPGGVKEKGQDISGWVLSPFYAGEQPLFEAVMSCCVPAFCAVLEKEPAALLPEWSKKTLIQPEPA